MNKDKSKGCIYREKGDARVEPITDYGRRRNWLIRSK